MTGAEERQHSCVQDFPEHIMTLIYELCRGAAQAGVLCLLLYLLSTRLDSFFETQQLPSNFTARNITLTVRTIVQAVSYLFTFICGVNTLGLTGESAETC